MAEQSAALKMLAEALMRQPQSENELGSAAGPFRGYADERAFQQQGVPQPSEGAAGGVPLGLFRPGVPTPYGRERDAQQMREQNGWLSASQTQYANDRPIQVFRPGIPNPIWGWGRQ